MASEHRYNLWFVATANNDKALTEVLEEIEKLTNYPVLILPMEESYHIDLAFNINFAVAQQSRH